MRKIIGYTLIALLFLGVIGGCLITLVQSGQPVEEAVKSVLYAMSLVVVVIIVTCVAVYLIYPDK